MRHTLPTIFGLFMITGCIFTIDDSDRDGIENRFDLCPGTPFDLRVDIDGCALQTQTYDPCQSTDECAEFIDSCQLIESSTSAAGICTRSCFQALDCPLTANGFEPVCVALSNNDGLCFETCNIDGDCASGFRCDVIDSGDVVCIPN